MLLMDWIFTENIICYRLTILTCPYNTQSSIASTLYKERLYTTEILDPSHFEET